MNLVETPDEIENIHFLSDNYMYGPARDPSIHRYGPSGFR